MTAPAKDGARFFPPILASPDEFADIYFGGHYVLVLRNNSDQFLPQRQTAVADAQSVVRVLGEPYGFEVILLVDATRRKIVYSRDRLRRRLTRNDNHAIYYAGHHYDTSSAGGRRILSVPGLEIKATVRFARLLIMLLFCGFFIRFAGCATPVKPASIPAEYKQIAIEVLGKWPASEVGVTASRQKQREVMVTALRKSILLTFERRGRFHTVAPPEMLPDPDVLVKVLIKKEYKSLFGLFSYGPLSVDVEVRDGKTEGLIRSSKLTRSAANDLLSTQEQQMASAIYDFTVEALSGAVDVARQDATTMDSPSAEQEIVLPVEKKIEAKVPEKEVLPLEGAAEPARLSDISAIKGVVPQRWAVVVGISNYRDTRVPGLRYAARDARAFYEWLVSTEGGGYAPSRVRLLLNENATFANIREALFTWLGAAIEEDVVVIYFAGHGSPDSPDTAGNLFLLPYDVEYDRIATTAFPMWDVETALRRFIKAKRVVVIADACHSGGVGRDFDVARRAGRAAEVNPISAGLQELSRVGEGVCVISASDDKQFSQESQKWGGGHGVFTHFLLEGLQGSADYNRDGGVTLGELIPFLSEHVRRETRNAQSPTVTGRFDPALRIGGR